MSETSARKDTARDSPGDGPPEEHRRRRRLLPRWRTLFAAALLTASLALGGLVAGYLLVEIPEPRSASAAQSNVYLYADGSQLARVGEVNRESVSLSLVPEDVRHAVLAAEDRAFFRQSAVDPKAMVRAAWNMLRGEGKQSGSTITQQYVKNYYLDQEQTLERKTKEFFIAVKLDREVSKEEILEGYLNTSYFGRNAYGIQAAAQAYYGKDTGELNVAEGAYLAALLVAPSAFDVGSATQNEGRAVARWEYVLDGMVDEGWLAASERAGLEFPEPQETRPSTGLSGQRGYLVEAVRDHLIESGVLDEQRLAAGGFRITTTIEPDQQEALTASVQEQLLDRKDEEREADSHLRAGATSVETETGRVVAMYGGEDYTRQFLNNATRRDYQAASTFKPFVYAAALEHEATTRSGTPIGPSTTYDGTSGREVLDRDGQGTGWSPENENEVSHGELTLRSAMDLSVNAVFAQLGQDVGPRRVADTARALGIPADTPGLDSAQGSVSLGTATPSTLDMAGAYATLARHGEHLPTVLVEEVSRGDEEIELPAREPERAVSREVADATTDLLVGVVEGGTGSAAGAVGRPAAGKTGTAEQDKAAWFAGYTPELATVVALMGQNQETGAQEPLYGALGLERVSGGGVPAAIWGQYTAAALEGAPVRDFDLEAREDFGETDNGPVEEWEEPADPGPPVTEDSRPPAQSPERSPEESAEPSPTGPESPGTSEPPSGTPSPTGEPEPTETPEPTEPTETPGPSEPTGTSGPTDPGTSPPDDGRNPDDGSDGDSDSDSEDGSGQRAPQSAARPAWSEIQTG
ncbi:transglycosylase domain-containing protein [Streptomyces sp. ACA25]|uniref:transglycosylase domain-containing protein n=1 Tax=Streptomyces sp. ACA25 TaxID=3022596 RepID=UPI002307E9C8|nr:transglycosylase domain-containing protein [Streptomyces sp. ACA25]MDB1089533.1 transglycosylase domain-containing protein [Streptomyces sp. ACA25]